MSHLKAFLRIIFIFAVFSAAGQTTHVIPFRLTEYNNISVKAVLNRIDTVDLMVHTAANSLTLTANSVKRLKSILFTNKTDSIKSWGGEANSARMSLNNSIQIGKLHWENVSIWENVNSGQETDGKFGIDLFAEWFVLLDYDQSEIRLSKTFPKNAGDYEKLKLENKDGNLLIEAQLVTKAIKLKNRFLIHSGYAGSLLLDDLFARNNRLSSELEVVDEQKLTDSYGNVVKVKKAIMPELGIGRLRLTNVPAGFFDGTIGTQNMSVLGGDVLKRFNIIIDAKREFIYLKPSKQLKSDYLKLK